MIIGFYAHAKIQEKEQTDILFPGGRELLPVTQTHETVYYTQRIQDMCTVCEEIISG